MNQLVQDHSIKQEMEQNSRSTNLSFPCVQCKAYFTTKQEFSKHHKIEHSIRDIYLEFEEIGRDNILAGTQNYDLKELNCVTCEKSYATKIQLWNHIHYSHGVPSKCYECNRSFQSKKKLQQHRFKNI